MWEKVKEEIKEHEGFRDQVYLDHLGNRTVGYGHLCVEDFWQDNKKYEKEFLNDIFEADFKRALTSAEELINLNPIKDNAKEVIIEMIFQLGKSGCAKFVKMWKALNKEDYGEASFQMVQSKWFNQTPGRADKLAKKMRNA